MARGLLDKVFGANVYIDGNNFVDKANVVNLPNINFQKSDHRPLGNFGTMRLWQGLEAMELSLEWPAFQPKVFSQSPGDVVDLTIRAVQQEWENGQLTRSYGVRIYAKGTPQNREGGTVSGDDGGNRTTSFDLHYYKLVVDGQDIVEADIPNKILRFEGNDIYASIREELGLDG